MLTRTHLIISGHSARIRTNVHKSSVAVLKRFEHGIEGLHDQTLNAPFGIQRLQIFLIQGLAVFVLAVILGQKSFASDHVDSSDHSDSVEIHRPLPEIEWDTKLSHFQFDADKFLGQRLTVKCPPLESGQSLEGAFGTLNYPSDTAICIAALHAGAITEEGGIVTVQLNPGESEYRGSQRHGVTTGDLPATRRSLSVLTDETSDRNDTLQLEHLPRLTWNSKFTATGFAYRNLVGQRFTFRVPEAPHDRKLRLVFGTDTYDFASVVCVAALHAGAVTRDGGIITVQLNAGGEPLRGSLRHGVETKSKGRASRTISFVTTTTKARDAQ